jgi:hypothetical protein
MGIFCEAFAFVGHKIDIPEDKFEDQDEAYDFVKRLQQKIDSKNLSGNVHLLVDNCDELFITFIVVKHENLASAEFKLGYGNDIGTSRFFSKKFREYSNDEIQEIEKALGYSIDQEKEIFCVSQMV